MTRSENFGFLRLRCVAHVRAAATWCHMSVGPPLMTSGPRDPKRPRPVPKPVRDVIVLMVRGRSDDPDGKPIDFVEAAKLCDVKPDVMRRWLDRPAVRSFGPRSVPLMRAR